MKETCPLEGRSAPNHQDARTHCHGRGQWTAHYSLDWHNNTGIKSRTQTRGCYTGRKSRRDQQMAVCQWQGKFPWIASQKNVAHRWEYGENLIRIHWYWYTPITDSWKPVIRISDHMAACYPDHRRLTQTSTGRWKFPSQEQRSHEDTEPQWGETVLSKTREFFVTRTTPSQGR